MWPFVIHDRRRGVLFGARDRFGVKPLFVHHGKDAWLLASEVKAILASGLYVRETNWQVAADFLLHGKLDETPATFYAGIEQVPPGCAFEIRLDGTWRQWRYWSLPDIEQEPLPDVEEAVAERSEERRVGKECRAGGAAEQSKEKEGEGEECKVRKAE